MTTDDQTSMVHTLLLADQNVTIQRVIQLTFANEGIDVVAVSDGDEAVARLDESRPDIVLADSGMPGRNGYELARHIKSTPALAHIPVLLLTGAFEVVDPEEVASAGCDGVLAKPFEPQAVIQRVRELLGRDATAIAAPAVASFDREAPPPIFGDVHTNETEAMTADGAIDNPAEMSVNLQSPPPAIEPVMGEAVDHGFEAGSPLLPSPVARGESATTPDPGQLDDYFDQLDRAITARVSVRPAPPPPPSAPEPAAPAEPSAVAVPKRPVLVDAFSALLAAEESATADPVVAMQALLPPPAPPVVVPPTIVVSEELVEKVVRRVLEEMSSRELRATVADVTASTAERLILEEIARIKSNIP